MMYSTWKETFIRNDRTVSDFMMFRVLRNVTRVQRPRPNISCIYRPTQRYSCAYYLSLL